MIQYRSMLPEKILGKNKEEVSIKGFRKRVSYPKNKIYVDSIKQEVLNRPDIISLNLYGNITKVSGIIDTNDTDIFSFKTKDTFNYANRNIAI